jgi:predicted  nucleic acid-binding Zn-ribbon protein
MAIPALEKLLILQDRDAKRLGLERQLRAVPVDIAQVEASIAGEKGAIEAARTEIKELEAGKKAIETEIGAAEDQLGRYKTQQLAVRKNDEYQALGHQIENTQRQIGEFEGRELEVMYSIDEARKRFAAAERTMKENIEGHEARIRTLKERGANLEAALKEAQAEVAAARALVDTPALQVYDRMAARGMPVVVPIHDGKCGGCHLKVSSEVESAARGKGPAGELPICDQCSRIVYWEPTP